MRMSDAERKVMEVVWSAEGIIAKDIALHLGQDIGWSKTTTYTMISICIDKGYLRREAPKFHCYSIVSKQEVSMQEAQTLIDNSFDGSADLLVAALVRSKKLSIGQLARVYDAMRELEAQE